MRQRVLAAVGLGAVVAAVAAGAAQPPVAPGRQPGPLPATPPAPLPGPLPPTPAVVPTPTPAAGQPPTPAAPPAAPPAARPAPPDTPLAKFDPLSAYPQPTQAAVRSVLRGADWLARRSQVQGRFLYGYNPALRKPLDGDHDLAQARAAHALAQAAKFAGDERHAAVATQAVLALLAMTRPDPADAGVRVPVRASAACNRVGFAAVLALAVYELPAPDERLVAEAEKLCGFLRRQLRTDGSVHHTDNPAEDAAQADPAGAAEYPGLALQALAVGNRVRPAGWKLDAVRKGVEHYRGRFKARPHPRLAATLTPAAAELYLQTNAPEAAAAVFELNDWLAGLQYAADARHPEWAGGFRGWAADRPADAAPGAETGDYLRSLAWACRVTRQTADVTRFGRYRQAAVDAAQFLGGLQYTEANTRHFENGFRATVLVGGFYLSPVDGTLRVDATAAGLGGMLQFLASGAER